MSPLFFNYSNTIQWYLLCKDHLKANFDLERNAIIIWWSQQTTVGWIFFFVSLPNFWILFFSCELIPNLAKSQYLQDLIYFFASPVRILYFFFLVKHNWFSVPIGTNGFERFLDVVFLNRIFVCKVWKFMFYSIFKLVFLM